jgi:hypothetical protein
MCQHRDLSHGRKFHQPPSDPVRCHVKRHLDQIIAAFMKRYQLSLFDFFVKRPDAHNFHAAHQADRDVFLPDFLFQTVKQLQKLLRIVIDIPILHALDSRLVCMRCHSKDTHSALCRNFRHLKGCGQIRGTVVNPRQNMYMKVRHASFLLRTDIPAPFSLPSRRCPDIRFPPPARVLSSVFGIPSHQKQSAGR